MVRRRLAVVATVGIIVWPTVGRLAAADAIPPGAEWVPGEVIVGFNRVPGPFELQCVRGCVPNALTWRSLRHARHPKDSPHGIHPLAKVRVVQLAPGQDVPDAVERIARLPGVAYAQPNYITHAALDPTDAMYALQGYAPEIIRAEEAWDITTGDADVLLAVADSGMHLDHVDLHDAIWSNNDPVNGVDDDQNGFIDDVRGWDFINHDSDPMATGLSAAHGTHVAGIAAARLNNGIGIAGMANATLMPLQVFNGLNGTWEAIAEAITYAVDNGADVVNYSGGASGGAGVLQTAVQYAWDHDVTVVAAVGNSATTILFYPAAYNTVIAVSGTGPGDSHYNLSNRGAYVDVAAPGVTIYSTYGTSTTAYSFDSGTSMSSPHVAGLVALMYSVNPTLHVDQVTQLLRENAVDLGTPGFDNFFGHGRIDAKETLDDVVAMTPPVLLTLPNGLPPAVPPGGTAELTLRIVSGIETFDPDSPTLHFRLEEGDFSEQKLAPLGANQFRGTLPGGSCGQTVSFYLSARSTEGSEVTLPAGAPTELFEAAVGEYVDRFADDFENDQNWQATFDGLQTSGQWVRETPLATTAQPGADVSVEGTKCFVTGNCLGGVNTCDVDLGPVYLTSPTLDLTGGNVLIEYARWFYSVAPDDTLTVEVSNDNGQSWVTLEAVGPGAAGGWVSVSYRLDDVLEPTAQVRVRFVVADAANNSTTEAAIDEFRVQQFDCVQDTAPPTIVHDGGVSTVPFSGYIDCRAESSNGLDLDRGIDQIVITFSEPVRNGEGIEGGGLTEDAFSVSGSAAGYPTVQSIDATQNPRVIVFFSGPIPVGEWTTISADVEDLADNPIPSAGNQGDADEPDRVDLGFLPADIDQNRAVQPLDLLRFRQMLQGTFHNPHGTDLDYADIDRNGALEPLDLLRLRQLILGTGIATRPWNGETLGPIP